MSFYGEQPKLGGINYTTTSTSGVQVYYPNFKFDAYYPSRYELTRADGTQVPIGACVLVSYYLTEASGRNTAGTSHFSPERYIQDNTVSTSSTNGSLTYQVQVENSSNFINNLNIDLQNYHNSYHNTVWQRVTANGDYSFIMIAELNSIAPQLDVEYLPSVELTNNNNNNNNNKPQKQTYTIGENGRTKKTLDELLQLLSSTSDPHGLLEEQNNNLKTTSFYYNKPTLDLENSSELGYKLKFPSVPYIIGNIHIDNTEPDSISTAYDKTTDSFVINAYLGQMREYMTKADNGLIIKRGSSSGTVVNNKIEFKGYWN